jgi:hypothetical protein
MSEINFRFATPEDAPAFTKWTMENPQIPQKDREAAMKENNPTATVLVLERDGVPVFFLPVYMTMRIAYCGFNPENTREESLESLETMLHYLKEFAKIWFINEIDVLTVGKLPIAQWAAAHDFKREDRELYTLKVVKPTKTSSPEEGTVQ